MRLAVLFLFLIFRTPASQALIADGDGYFPVVVMVANESGRPIMGVPVRLHDAGRPKQVPENPDPRLKHLGQPVETNASGAAVLLYYGRWSSNSNAGHPSYTRHIRGIVVIDVKGYERIESSVAEAAGGDYTSQPATWAPVIVITLKRKNE